MAICPKQALSGSIAAKKKKGRAANRKRRDSKGEGAGVQEPQKGKKNWERLAEEKCI